ncbi:hypothetical protein [Streptomyces sp. NPDC002666]
MEDTTPERPSAPKHITTPGQRIAIAVSVVAAIAAAFAAGRVTRDEPEPDSAVSSTCQQAVSEATRGLETAKTENAKSGVANATTPEGEQAAYTAFVVISQNPGCFTPGDRATAETYLTQRKESAARRDAECASATNALQRASC